ncbi:MAG: T9SS type A sorting domain-containing protein [Ignavibacteriae bacterium]|nr:T9SS C-terminal target domain-containing protein [Ignavibacteriota bacterium]NOG99730.1 T9SS type A sorting domain-containing protein [Ignavibacteriota bacterium]
MKMFTAALFILFFISNLLLAQWTYVTPPETFFGGNYVLSHNSELYFANNKDVYKTTDDGNTWVNLTNGFVTNLGNSNIMIEIAGSNIFVGSTVLGVFMSPDNGSTWQSDTSGLEGSFNCHIIYSDGTNIFSSFDWPTYGFYMKPASAGSWTRVNSNSIGSGYAATVKGMTKVNNTLYAATRNSGVFESTDNGTTWTQKTNSGLPSPIDGQHGDRLLNIGSDLFVSTDNGIYKSTDQADSWTRVDQGFAVWNQFNVAQIWGMYTDGSNLYASMAQDDSAYYSTNGGSSWSDISGGLNHRLKSFAMHNGTLFAAQWDIDSSIVKYTGLTGIEKENEFQPEIFSLSQNYPNPFNPSTKISFSIPSNTFVTLSIYDILGSKITELINEEMSPGQYSIDFDASDLASGIYYYTLSTNNSAISKKMILLK